MSSVVNLRMTKVKICGITNLKDALLSVKFGADALGFNFYAKSPRYIEPQSAREIINELPENVLKVGVFVNEDIDTIVDTAETAGLDAIQLHGEETPDFAKDLVTRTGLEIIKAFRVSPDFDREQVLEYNVDAILLDAYSPKEHGGTGKTFDWRQYKKFYESIPKLYLAGGLSHENVIFPISLIQPYAVDACSNLEKAPGVKDENKLINFISTVKNYNFAKLASNGDLPIENIFDLLALIQSRPGMYFGEKSLTKLKAFLDGFRTGFDFGGRNFDWKNFNELHDFAAASFGWYESTSGWANIILKEANGNEQVGYDMFFVLLEKFKLARKNVAR